MVPGTRNFAGTVQLRGRRYTKSIAAVAATSTATATHFEWSTRTNAAHTASAFVTDRRAILTTRPTLPEKAAIARASRPGLKTGWPGVVAVEAVVALTALLSDSESGRPRGRPPGRLTSADL